ncbi:MAG: hypothetical protein SFY92_04380 [Verrucomicrobiae bacterium]|nr:hypothetical protein [Verrucomicrobiae bacterium]
MKLVLLALMSTCMFLGCHRILPPEQPPPPPPKQLSPIERAQQFLDKKEPGQAIMELSRAQTDEALEMLISLLKQDKLHETPHVHASSRSQIISALRKWPAHHDRIWAALFTLMRERQAQDAWMVNEITSLAEDWSVHSPEYSRALAEAVVACPDKGMTFTLLRRLDRVMSPEAAQVLLQALPQPLDQEKLTKDMLGMIVNHPVPEAVPLLRSLVRDRQYPLLFEAAALALCKSGDEESVAVVETRYNAEQDFDTRQKLSRALMTAPQPRFRELMAKGLGSTSSKVLRLDAARALAQTARPEDSALIQMYLGDPDPRIRHWMVQAAVKAVPGAGSQAGWREFRDKWAAQEEGYTALRLSEALQDPARVASLRATLEGKQKAAADSGAGLAAYLGKKQAEVKADFPAAKVTVLSRDMSTGSHLLILNVGWILVVPGEHLRMFGNNGTGPYGRISLLRESTREVFGIRNGDPGSRIFELHGPPREAVPQGVLSYDFAAGEKKVRVYYLLDSRGTVEGIDLVTPDP